MTPMHGEQINIMRELLFAPEIKFSTLQKSSDLDPDHFKFHLHRLTTLGFVEKVARGTYKLTIIGKEYANKLDTDDKEIERQPKISVLLLIEREGRNGETEYLFQQRLKNPFFGFWALAGGKVRWGETLVDAAARELEEETKLTGDFKFEMVYHKLDYDQDKEILEDKIFIVMRTTNATGKLMMDFEGGHNEWMTVKQFKNQDKRFTGIDEIFNPKTTIDDAFFEKEFHYDSNQY